MVQQIDAGQDADRRPLVVDDDRGRALAEQLIERRERRRQPSPQPRKFMRSASVTMPTSTPPDVTGSCEMPRSRIFSTTSRSVSVSSATTIEPLRATRSSTRPSIARVWKKPLSRIHLSSTNLVM
jgi:hypothetical protein